MKKNPLHLSDIDDKNAHESSDVYFAQQIKNKSFQQMQLFFFSF